MVVLPGLPAIVGQHSLPSMVTVAQAGARAVPAMLTIATWFMDVARKIVCNMVQEMDGRSLTF